jgi:TRAP-type mannitol/chloroaromatic compound transport system permease large subunit
MMPFMLLQWLCVLLIYFFPQVALFLPNLWYN